MRECGRLRESSRTFRVLRSPQIADHSFANDVGRNISEVQMTGRACCLSFWGDSRDASGPYRERFARSAFSHPRSDACTVHLSLRRQACSTPVAPTTGMSPSEFPCGENPRPQTAHSEFGDSTLLESEGPIHLNSRTVRSNMGSPAQNSALLPSLA